MALLQTVLCLLFVAIVTAVDKWPPPPPWQEKAQMDWGVVSAVSPEYSFIPFGTLQSFADGPMGNSTGVPYFYIAAVSDTMHNIKYNNTVSLTMSQAESEYCVNKAYDPEEPLCARLTLYGKVEPLKDEQEMQFAKKSLFSRHPAMADWPLSHGWSFFALRLQGVCLLDFYGGASHVSLSDYFASHP